VDIDTGIITRVASGAISAGDTVHIKYEALSNGIISLDLARDLVVNVNIPFSGYSVRADITTVPQSVTELRLEDLALYPFLQNQ
jgi:hypothetical protein